MADLKFSRIRNSAMRRLMDMILLFMPSATAFVIPTDNSSSHLHVVKGVSRRLEVSTCLHIESLHFGLTPPTVSLQMPLVAEECTDSARGLTRLGYFINPFFAASSTAATNAVCQMKASTSFL
jgi:hypothetical protein